MVVDPDVGQHALPGLVVTRALDHDDGGRHPPAGVAALALGGHQGGDQAGGQDPVRVLEGLGHGLADAGPGHHVGLGRVAVPSAWPTWSMQSAPVNEATRPAASTRPTWRTSRPSSAARTWSSASASREAVGQQVEAAGPVARVDHGLGGHRADAGPGPGQHRAEGEVAALGGHAELAAGRCRGRRWSTSRHRRSASEARKANRAALVSSGLLLLHPVAGPLDRGACRGSRGAPRPWLRRHRASWSLTGSSEPVRKPMGMV